MKKIAPYVYIKSMEIIIFETVKYSSVKFHPLRTKKKRISFTHK